MSLDEPISHLTDAQVWSMVLGDVSGTELAQCEGHLADCVDCRAWVAELSSASSRSTAEDTGGPPLRLRQGERVGRYLVLELIGAGGFGLVYSAFDPSLDRKVAIKVVRFHGEDPQRDSDRLLAEAQLQAKLTHPNVVVVYDSGHFRPHHTYVVMEHLEGTLRQWLAKEHTLDELLGVFLEAGAGLNALHEAGVLHCDFKADNVLIGADGRPRVGDFGLSMLDAGAQTAGARGTQGYLAPELLAGAVPSHRSDQYSFCATLSEALEGKRTPRAVLQVLRRGREALAAQRFSNMAQLLAALRRARRRRQQARWLGVGLGALLLVGIGAGARQLRVEAECEGGPSLAARVWNAGSEAALRQRLQAVAPASEPFASGEVVRAFGVWLAQWTSLWGSLCQAQPQLGGSAWPGQRACLEAQLDDVGALAQAILATGPTGAARDRARSPREPAGGAVDLARLLPRAVACEAPRHAVSRERPQLRQDVVQLDALVELGQYPEALERGLQLLPEAAAAADRALHARVLTDLGNAEEELGHFEPAYARYLEGLQMATQGGVHGAVAMAAMHLATLNTKHGGAVEAANGFMRVARDAIEREPHSDHLLASWYSARAFNATVQSRWEAAIEGFAKVIELKEKDPFVGPAALARAHANLAAARSNAGQGDLGVEELTRARELMAQALGPAHGDTLRVEQMLANALSRTGRHAEALARTQGLLERVKDGPGDRRLDVARIQRNLGGIHQRLRQHREAAISFEASVHMLEEVVGPDSFHLIESASGWAESLLEAYDVQAALPIAERAYVLMSRVSGGAPEPPRDGDVCFILGKLVWAAQGDQRRATQLFAEAASHYEKTSPRDVKRIDLLQVYLRDVARDSRWRKAASGL